MLFIQANATGAQNDESMEDKDVQATNDGGQIRAENSPLEKADSP